jgi:hypothetical protein
MSIVDKATRSKQHFDAREWKLAAQLFYEIRDELAQAGKEAVQLGDGNIAIVIERDSEGNVTKTEPLA